MTKKLKPVHPGEILREEFMVPLGRTRASPFRSLKALVGNAVQMCGSSVGRTGDRAGNASRRSFDRPGVEKWDGDIYRESSHIQLISHVFPPSDEKDCSIRDDLGEMLSQT
jgi:hypothetical protein